MFWLFIFPMFLGVAAVLQGGLNRQISDHIGLAGAVVINNIVLLGFALILYAVSMQKPAWLPDVFYNKASMLEFKWWYIFPGLMGYSLVAGVPWAISKIGALNLFVGLVGAQMVASILWDYYFENTPITMLRIFGAVLAFSGVFVLSLQK